MAMELHPNPHPFSGINGSLQCSLSSNQSSSSSPFTVAQRRGVHNNRCQPRKMQAAAAACLTGALPIRSTKTLATRKAVKPQRAFVVPIKAVATPETTDYSSPLSVFPMEACDVLGGEACNAKMYPEVKLEASGSRSNSRAPEEVDRDYVEYNETKTVFPGEACDDLGGEFCEAEYQNGVY